MVQQILAKKKPEMAAYIEENDGNFNTNMDFSDKRHLESLAMERLVRNLDKIIHPGQKLRHK